MLVLIGIIIKMKIKYINKNLVDVFLDMNIYPTGWEPSCWLRLQKRGNTWIQLGGIKLPSWKFKQLTKELK